MPKIISECCELVKLCHINCSGPVFLDTLYICTMADQQKVVCDLSNGAIFYDLERPYPQFQGHAIL